MRLIVAALALAFSSAVQAEHSLLARLQDARAAAKSTPDAHPGLADLQAFTGDAAGALRSTDLARGAPLTSPAPRASQLASLDGAQAEEAIAAIVAAARNKRAVLINEAHTVPLHRAFTRKLALELRKIGFTYLACEAFNEYVTELGNGAHVRTSDGYYLQDPIFAQFVNDAIKAGYRLVPYEIEDKQATASGAAAFRQREQVQARNLYQRIFVSDPKAKVLIHVGHHHLLKQPVEGVTLMGTHLRRMLGTDATLHVDQTFMHAHSAPQYEHPLYRQVLAKFTVKQPIVLRGRRGGFLTFFGKPGVTDMDVIFPDYADQHGRPGWLGELAERQPVPVPPQLLPQSGERLVYAYAAQHGGTAQPTDVVLVRAGQPAPPLMLPEGEFRFKAAP